MLLERLRKALASPPDGGLVAGDDIPSEGVPVPAAVLVAITDQSEPGLILTVRREHLRTHAGQIAFPGGRVDEGEDASGAALREAYEELLLDPASVALAGTMASYRTVTGFAVTPVVGVIAPAPVLAIHEDEVADWFEVPLDHVLDPANQVERTALFRGASRRYYEIMWNDRRIWGATAAMIVNLSRLIR